ncbi:lysine-rich arabinogalactan protein 17-like [Mustela erminea]|uniref:lysine-rich arabinogalactan protein 17-like n=1 Tax=Mustela erminea TaxID=36723 RepID=UPI001386878B|nr:lysine-rich arabinogalactan protein 17-like [Mustela erminea]
MTWEKASPTMVSFEKLPELEPSPGSRVNLPSPSGGSLRSRVPFRDSLVANVNARARGRSRRAPLAPRSPHLPPPPAQTPPAPRAPRTRDSPEPAATAGAALKQKRRPGRVGPGPHPLLARRWPPAPSAPALGVRMSGGTSPGSSQG